MMIKKAMLYLMLLMSLTSCVYIGLSSKEIQQHNEKILEQLGDFPLSNYEGTFYSFPEEEDKMVQFHCQNGNLELLIITKDHIIYNTGTQEYDFSTSTLQESMHPKNGEGYSYPEEIEALISFIKEFDGTSSKVEGRSGVEADEEGPLDEITHYYYEMDWTYSDVAGLYFYVNAKTSSLKSIYLTDHSNDGGFGKPHFQLWLLKEQRDSSLKTEYESRKEAVTKSGKGQDILSF